MGRTASSSTRGESSRLGSTAAGWLRTLPLVENPLPICFVHTG